MGKVGIFLKMIEKNIEFFSTIFFALSGVSNAQIQKIQIQNSQIQKYNIWQSAKNTQHVIYFLKEDYSRISKWYSHVSNAHTKIQIHKYTSTAYDKVPEPERPNMFAQSHKGWSSLYTMYLGTWKCVPLSNDVTYVEHNTEVIGI